MKSKGVDHFRLDIRVRPAKAFSEVAKQKDDNPYRELRLTPID